VNAYVTIANQDREEIWFGERGKWEE